MKSFFTIIFCLLMLLVLTPVLSLSQTSSEGSLNSEVLSKIQRSFKMDNHDKTMLNALTNNEIKNLALNREDRGGQ